MKKLAIILASLNILILLSMLYFGTYQIRNDISYYWYFPAQNWVISGTLINSLIVVLILNKSK